MKTIPLLALSRNVDHASFDPDVLAAVFAVLLMIYAVRLLNPALVMVGELLRVVLKGAAAALVIVVALALLVISLGAHLIG